MGKDTKNTKTKNHGLSNGVKVRYGRGYGRIAKTETVFVNKSSKRLEKERLANRNYIAGTTLLYDLNLYSVSHSSTELSFENRDAILDDDVTMGEPSGTAGDDSENAWENLDGLNMVPPGEEGIFLSNAGGEDAVFYEIIDYVVPKKYATPFSI
jgi:hypothetical protein